MFMLNQKAYCKMEDSDRRDFIQAYPPSAKDLKWMDSYTLKILAETEVDVSLKGMMTMCLV